MKSLKNLLKSNLDDLIQSAIEHLSAQIGTDDDYPDLNNLFADLFAYLGTVSLREEKDRAITGLFQKLKMHIRDDSKYLLRFNILETLRSTLIRKYAEFVQTEISSRERVHQFIGELVTGTAQICFLQYTQQQHKLKKKEQTLISDLTIVKNDLQNQLNVIYQLIKDAPIGMAACDENFLVEYWNPMATRLTGYHQGDILRRSFQNILTAESRTQFISKLAPGAKSIRRMKLDLQLQNKGSVPFWLSVSELKDSTNGKIKYVINFYDLKKDEKIRSQGEKIDQLSAIARLSGAIMHDIRNPINTIGLNLDLVEQYLTSSRKMSPEISDLLNKVHQQISQLAQNLNYYLGYTKLSDLNAENINLSKSLADFIVDMQYQHSGNNINIKSVKPRKDITISCDWILLRRALLNLFQNAVESIEKDGEIKIGARIIDQKVLISISDNGSGMDRQEIAKIYKPYYSTKNSGTGLGLFITREIIRAHGGRLYCSSKKDVGTKFTISLPLYLSN